MKLSKTPSLFPQIDSGLPQLPIFTLMKQGKVTNDISSFYGLDTISKMKPSANLTKKVFEHPKQRHTILRSTSKDVKIRVSTLQLFDAIMEKVTAANSKQISFSIDDYMKKRGLKNIHDARIQIKADLNTLRTLSVDYVDEYIEAEGFSMLLDSVDYFNRKGLFVITLGDRIYQSIKHYKFAPFPSTMYIGDNQKNPHRYHLIRYISYIKNLNIGKDNEDIYSVQSLLEVLPDMPTFEDVQKKDRHYKERIIKPFERDLNSLSDTFSWEYCYSKNNPLPKEEYDSLTYEKFIALKIAVTWSNYPALESKSESDNNDSEL